MESEFPRRLRRLREEKRPLRSMAVTSELIGLPPGAIRKYERGEAKPTVESLSAIKAQADKVVYMAQQYTPGCMHKRNRHLVDHSGVCVCYLTKESGGTAYTVNYAKRHGVEIINIAWRDGLYSIKKCVSP